MRVAVIHLDLGIGGAEQLVLNVCSGLLSRQSGKGRGTETGSSEKNETNETSALGRTSFGRKISTRTSSNNTSGGNRNENHNNSNNNIAHHDNEMNETFEVDIYTSHHDLSHCFTETKKNGNLHHRIIVAGDWLPRHIFGKATAMCASIRMIYLALFIIWIHLYNSYIRKANKPFYIPYTYKKEGSPRLERLEREERERETRENGGNINNHNIEVENTNSCESFYDAIFADGVSTMIPIFNLARLPTVFYCHFPDKYLCTERKSFLKKMYRLPLDTIENLTTRSASTTLVNSSFTQSIYRKAFLSHIKREIKLPIVLYPPVNLTTLVPPPSETPINGHILSLNRFERKKNINLAIEAYSHYLEELDRINRHNDKVKAEEGSKRNKIMPANVRIGREEEEGFSKLPLKIAGGYDTKNTENIEHFKELEALVTTLQISERGGKVEFCPSVSDQERAELLTQASILLYTPDKEHFGIVPLEAMYAGCPVIAVASGGPLETIHHKKTGYLVSNTPSAFGDAIIEILVKTSIDQRRMISNTAHLHVIENFGLEKFHTALKKAVKQTATEGTKGVFFARIPSSRTNIALRERGEQSDHLLPSLRRLVQRKYLEISLTILAFSFAHWYYLRKEEEERIFGDL